MRTPSFDYERPKTIQAACGLLRDGGSEAHPIAGGTELVLAVRNRQKPARLLVDLGSIGGLNLIRYSPETGLRIGPMATLRHLSEHPDVRQHYPMLVQAATSAGSPQIQAMGTIGGNLCQDTCCQYFNRSAGARRTFEPCHKLGGNVCHVVPGASECWATYAGDLAPALIALGATIRITQPDGERDIPASEFFTGDGARPRDLRHGDVVSSIEVPPVNGAGQAYVKLRLRGTLDYPIVAVAARVNMEDGNCRSMRVVLTGVDRRPVEVEEAKQVQGTPLSTEVIRDVAKAAHNRAHPMKTVCELPASYRRQMVDVFVESAVSQARDAARR